MIQLLQDLLPQLNLFTDFHKCCTLADRMFWKFIKWFFASVVCVVLLGIAGNISIRWLSGEQLQNLPVLLQYVQRHAFSFVTLTIALSFLTLLARHRESLNILNKQVTFYRRTSRLNASHVKPSAAWFDPYFLSRPAVKEASISLTSKSGVLLIGVPLVGKTRCAYEVLKTIRGHYVLGLIPEKRELADIKLPRSFGWRKPRLIIFLDDLNQFIGIFSPEQLWHHFHKQSKELKILATCRDGKEWSNVQADQAFSNFVLHQQISLVRVTLLTQDEEKTMASALGRPWGAKKYDGTPGSLFFELEAMRHRLESGPDDAKKLMRAMSLMNHAGIVVFSRQFVEAAARELLSLSTDPLTTTESWHYLQSNGFLTYGEDSIALTHAVYIEASFSHIYLASALETENLLQFAKSSGAESKLFSVAMQLAKTGDHARAEVFFRSYLKFSPNDVAAHSHLGVVLIEQGKAEEAEKELREAIRLGPNHAPAYTDLGNVLTAQGRTDEAEKRYREALRCDADYLRAHLKLGLLLHSGGKLKKAEQQLREAIRCHPSDAEGYFTLGLMLANQGTLKEAEKLARQGISCDPSDTIGSLCLGIILERQGRNEEAAIAFREALHREPNFAPAHFNLGYVLHKQGNRTGAEFEYREAIRCDEDYAQGHFGLALSHREMGNKKGEERELREVIRCAPDVGDGHFALAVVLEEQGRLEPAKKEYREAIRCSPKYSEAHYNLGLLLQKEGMIKAAEREYRRAVRCDPNHVDARVGMGLMLLINGKKREAEAEFRNAIRRDKNQGMFYYGLSMVLKEQGKVTQAKQAAQEAKKLGYPSRDKITFLRRCFEVFKRA